MKKILKKTAIIGGSSIINIITGMIKNKLLSIIVGPSGVGTIGLLMNLQATFTVIASMGMGQSVIKEISSALNRNDNNELKFIFKSLIFTSLITSTIISLLFFFFKDQISLTILNNKLKSGTIGLIAIGIIAATISGAQIAFLTGLNKINYLAKINIYKSIVGLFIAIFSIILIPQKAIIIIVISLPLIDILTSISFIRKIKLPSTNFNLLQSLVFCKKLLQTGFPFMAATLLTSSTQMLVRVLITINLGIEATGYFQASWSISMLYLMFILNSMATDYYPRLTSIIEDSEKCVKLINQQTQIALMLSGPIIALMIIFSPFVIKSLYSENFTNSIAILRWQLLGDFFKVAVWPLGFVLAAKGKSMLFFYTELFWVIIYISTLWLGLPIFGINASGQAFLVAYIFYFILIWIIVYRLIQFEWDKITIKYLLTVGFSITTIMILQKTNENYSFLISITIALALSISSINTIVKEFKINKQ